MAPSTSCFNPSSRAESEGGIDLAGTIDLVSIHALARRASRYAAKHAAKPRQFQSALSRRERVGPQ
jgi:hypothetical protein